MLESQQCMSARYLMFFFYLTNSAALIPLQYLLEFWLSGYWIARGPMIKIYLIAIFKKLLLLAFVQSVRALKRVEVWVEVFLGIWIDIFKNSWIIQSY